MCTVAKQSEAPPTAELDPELTSELVDLLEGRLDSIIEDLMVTYRANIPSYASAPPSFLEEVRAGTTASFLAGLAILRGDVELTDVMDPLEELGRRRASQGIPLAEALLAWQISARAFWENIVDIAPADPETRARVITVGTRVIMELLQRSISALSTGYLEAEEERVVNKELDIQGIVEILAGVRPADRHYSERAARRGVGLDDLRWCVVSQVPEESIGQQSREWRRILTKGAVGRIGAALVAYAPGDDPPAVSGPYLGVAQTSDTQAGFRRARGASLVARHLRKSMVRYEEVVPLAMLLNGPAGERDAFVSAQLGAVEGDPLADELLRSLETYLANGQSIAAAARALHVHRHTLEYRLERVAALLGDFREPGRGPFLELALALRH
jgi:PucR-like helix-turn-helix protein